MAVMSALGIVPIDAEHMHVALAAGGQGEPFVGRMGGVIDKQRHVEVVGACRFSTCRLERASNRILGFVSWNRNLQNTSENGVEI